MEPVDVGRFGAVFLADEPDEDVVFFGVGFLGPGLAEPPEGGLAGLVGDFFAGDGRLAAGRGALLRGAAAAGAGAGVRRVLPQFVQAFSSGSLKVSQSAQRQLVDAATPVLPSLLRGSGVPD
ncbi:hypothetical protein [Streptomyces auratus]|uniref:Uncharacterized protein n=1 Tax=Streptomyces auratus AGR0001 TaxID=1160718 RepID=A0A8B1NFX0_9ACTN|nr:hypothetical protein [Streptomyces auratus]QTZ93809.1 hypothetical protein SU9_022115 [Streptomyces auratus AGR0001]